MQHQLATLKAEIQAMYDFPEFKKHPYNLHSILIHDGQAGSGHYYAYIVEPESKKWRKYSDINVTEVTHEEVLANSLGGVGQMSAYCFFYVRPDIVAP
jgi:ubiquitin carboxyl-terminal hydrolase 25/28